MRWGQQPPHVWYRGYVKPCSDHCQEEGTTAAACFVIRPYKTMLRPLSWNEDHSRRMFLYAAIYNHAQNIAMRLWQHPAHVWYQELIKSCLDEDNSRRMFPYTAIWNHAQTNAMIWGQQPPHVSLYCHIKPCSDHCHEITTTAAACLISGLYNIMLRPLRWGQQQSPHDSLCGRINHAQSMLRPLSWDKDI